MVKCVVSRCPNRQVDVNRGIFKRPPKRFFEFPTDPARVKVWLAALRETDSQDSTDSLICEDHFLPEDISLCGVSAEAIPIMPPCLDEHMDTWGAGSSGEEEEGEENGWACDAAAAEDEGGADVPAAVEVQQDSKETSENTSLSLNETKETVQTERNIAHDWSLAILTQRFLELFLTAPDGLLDLRQATESLRTHKQRVDDIAGILSGIDVIEKQTADRIKWIGRSPISSFLWKNQGKFQRELQDLTLVEDALDSVIRGCSEQLFSAAAAAENSALAYLTLEDLSRLDALQEQTVIVVKAPEETRLLVAAATEDSIRVHLKAGAGPITALTCDVAAAGKSGSFVTLEESRIPTATLHTGETTGGKH